MAVVLFFNARLLWICVFVFLWCLRILETWCTTVICIGDMKQWHPLLIKSFFIILMSSTQKRITSEQKTYNIILQSKVSFAFRFKYYNDIAIIEVGKQLQGLWIYTHCYKTRERYMQQQRGKLLFNGIGNFCFYFLLNQNIWSACEECFFGL